MSEKKDTKKAIKHIAKKDFVICQNGYYCEIKKGNDIIELNIPEKYLKNLKIEEVI